MAIYYIDPHTTTNGSGTWASPWSLNSSTRTGLAAGDEIRIKGVALTSLLTATSYTATLTSAQTLTITAGGNLGYDWAVGDVGYLPDYDTFFKVASTTTLSSVVITGTSGQFSCAASTLTVGQIISITGTFGGTGSITNYSSGKLYYIIATNGTTAFTLSETLGGTAITTTTGTPTGLTYTSGNAISVSTSSILPIYNWSVTSLTVRRVNLASYPASSLSTTTYLVIGSGNIVNNITVSDCWIDATTRVTDGSVKSLLHSAYTSAAIFYPVGYLNVSSGCTVNLQNSIVMCGVNAISVHLSYSASTINIGQVFSNGTSGGFTASSSYPTTGTTVNITHLAAPIPMAGFGASGQNNTFNITNLSAYYSDYLFGSSATCTCTGNTVNLTNVFAYGFAGNNPIFSIASANELSINFTGTLDFYGIWQPSILFNGAMSGNITIGSSVVGYYNKRTSTIATITTKWNISSSNYQTIFAPNITVNNSWSFTNKYNASNYFSSSINPSANLPLELLISLPNTTDLPSGTPYGFAYPMNQTIIGRDGSTPFQILAIYGIGGASSNVNTQFPKVTTDATVYKTTGPSLKSYLATRSSTYWLTKAARSVKTIKVPCVAGTSYTVSGFIRTDDASYVNGDVRCSIFFNDLEVVGQDMTTASINGWEQFTLTFTASQTAEYVFVWKMYYENGAKSYWLDDLTIN